MPKYTKPSACAGCSLEHLGAGYVPGNGPISDLAFLGEAPGYDEVEMGGPFVGAAGGMHTRILRMNHLSREAHRHENVLRCCPPGYEIKKAWAEAAAHHCAPYRTEALQSAKVIVALGGTAIRAALGLWNFSVDQVKVNDYHGTVHQLPSGQYVVPTFHPSYLQRGAVNMLGVVSFDLQVAMEVLRGEYHPDPIEPIIDPPLDWFEEYVRTYEQALQHDPYLWLSEDIETPDKEKGKSEDELGEDDKSFQIDRVNFAYDRTQGVTVPYDGPYIPLIARLTAAAQRIVGWNFDYDARRLLTAGHTFHPQVEVFDGMLLAHHLRSNIPLGLGLWAPFYSRHGAWKHLFATDPGTYAACDGPQAFRVVHGVVSDLIETGQWNVAYRHTVRFMQRVLKPASHIGIYTHRPTLDAFEAGLTRELDYRLTRLQEIVPTELRPLTPKEGLTRPPTGLHPKARMTNTRTGEALADAEDRDPLKVDLYERYSRVVELPRMTLAWYCDSCQTDGVVQRHRCADKALTPSVRLVEMPRPRWFWQEPFNPDSPDQVKAYLAYYTHTPGRNKKTKKDTADRETLKRLRAAHQDHEFYPLMLEIRSLGKVRGTYAIGVRKRLDPESRFHPQFTLRPSTLRTSATAPNIQNVVGDKEAGNLAAGFRACIQATQAIPSWAQDWTPEQLAAYIDGTEG